MLKRLSLADWCGGKGIESFGAAVVWLEECDAEWLAIIRVYWHELISEKGSMLLQTAATHNAVRAIEFFAQTCGIDVNSSGGKVAPLLWAVLRGNMGAAHKLLLLGADVKSCDFMGNTALTVACLADSVDLVRLLLKKALL